MKLEPHRSSLSSLPVAAQEPPSRTVAAPPPRKCCKCDAADRTEVVQGQYEPNGEQTIWHLVTVDVRYLKSAAEFTARHKRIGWRLRVFQGKTAIERFVCRPCLLAFGEMEREHKRKIDQELKSQQAGDSYYLAVCGE